MTVVDGSRGAPGPGRIGSTLDWWRPLLYGRPAALEAMSTVAAPLLAGFSVTLLGVVAQNEEEFRYPGVAIFFCTVAAVFFMVSLQSGFWSRQYLVTPSEVMAWHPDVHVAPEADREELKRIQRVLSVGFEAWADRSKRYYNLGLLTLLAGVGTAVAPRGDAGEPAWRWAAAAVTAGMFLFELYWTVVPGWMRRHGEFLGQHPYLDGFLDRWFRPARQRVRKRPELVTGGGDDDAG